MPQYSPSDLRERHEAQEITVLSHERHLVRRTRELYNAIIASDPIKLDKFVEYKDFIQDMRSPVENAFSIFGFAEHYLKRIQQRYPDITVTKADGTVVELKTDFDLAAWFLEAISRGEAVTAAIDDLPDKYGVDTWNTKRRGEPGPAAAVYVDPADCSDIEGPIIALMLHLRRSEVL